MAAYVMIRVELEGLDVGGASQRLRLPNIDAHSGVVELRNLMEALLAGGLDGQVVVATRDTTQAIAASGSGSETATFSLK